MHKGKDTYKKKKINVIMTTQFAEYSIVVIR